MILRQLKESDAPLMLEWMHDTELVKDLHKNFSAMTIDNCISFIKSAVTDKKNLHLAIADDNDEYHGYTLNGWFTAKTGGTKVLPSTKVTTAKDHTLYAQWTVNSYKVKFIANNPYGTTVSGKMSDEAYKYKDNKALTTNAYKVTGYRFTGWALAESAAAVFADKEIISGADLEEELNAGETLELFGTWTPETYTLTFVIGQGQPNVAVPAQYGASVQSIIASSEELDDAIDAAKADKAKEMKVEGYYISTSYTAANKVNASTKVAGAKTYYVRWVADDGI